MECTVTNLPFTFFLIVWIGKMCLFSTENTQKQVDYLLLLLLNLSLEYAIRKSQENQERLIVNGTHQLLLHANALTYCANTYLL